jgi:hypothetical protein
VEEVEQEVVRNQKPLSELDQKSLVDELLRFEAMSEEERKSFRVADLSLPSLFKCVAAIVDSR